MPQLKMLRGPDPNTIYELEKNVITIGRGRKNDIIIQDNEVSRTHCRLVRVLDDYEIHDLTSTNGTFVNGQKVEAGGWLLSNESLVEMGDSITLEYVSSDVITGTSLERVALSAEADEDAIFYLIIQQQSQPSPEIYVLDRSTITIGRETDNDIVLTEPEVSRHHMRLMRNDQRYAVEDLNTMNGTTVNHSTILKQHRLKINDRIGIGTGVILWYTDDPDALIAHIIDEKLSETELINKPADDDPPTMRRSVALETDLSASTLLQSELQTGQLEQTLFMTYARQEWAEVGAHLYQYLSDNNIRVFVEQHLTPHTRDWQQSIEQAIIESPCLLAIISEKSLESPTVTRALRYFLTREKSILLLRYGRLHQFPSTIRNMPAIPYEKKNPEKSFRLVLAELRRIGIL